MDRFIEFALVAADKALAQAGWKPTEAWDQERTATIISSGVGGLAELRQCPVPPLGC
ncbi:3-oxoacyl-(acyl carrier protein) synthase II [compost metagenome]